MPTGPTRLMAGAAAAAGVAMKIFVEWYQIAPVRIVVEELVGTEDRALAILVPQKEQCQAACQIVRNLRESHQVAGTGRALDLERVAVILMILAEREKNQMIYRHPDGAAPVGIAAKEFGGWGQFPGRDS